VTIAHNEIQELISQEFNLNFFLAPRKSFLAPWSNGGIFFLSRAKNHFVFFIKTKEKTFIWRSV
jgi:hypothetical protein